MDDDDKMTLRDKFAIEVLQGVIQREHNHEAIDFINSFDNPTDDWKKNTTKRMERLIRAAYKIADLMRKVRLTAFE